MIATKDTLTYTPSIAPLLRTTTISGTGVDLSNFGGNTFLFIPGAITDGTHTPTLEESDSSGSGYSTVAAADQVGTLAALVANTVQEASYIGAKRYVRAVVTVTGSPSTGANVAVGALLTKGRKQP